MKTLDDYMRMNYRMEVVQDPDEGGYVVSFPDLPGCITCGENIEAALSNAENAKRAWLEAAMESGIQIAEPNASEKDSGQVRLRLPRGLHRELAEKAKQEGVSMNQYCIYLLSKIFPMREKSEN